MIEEKVQKKYEIIIGTNNSEYISIANSAMDLKNKAENNLISKDEFFDDIVKIAKTTFGAVKFNPEDPGNNALNCLFIGIICLIMGYPCSSFTEGVLHVENYRKQRNTG